MYIRLRAKYPLFLSDCKKKVEFFPTDFLKHTNFRKIRPVADELFYAEKQTYRQIWRN